MVQIVKNGAAYAANSTEGMMDFSVMPPATYLAHITGSEEKPTKDETNEDTYINLEFTILAGDFKGRKIWTILNTNNSSQKAVEMAYKELTSIMDAIGIPNATDTAELQGKPLNIKLKITAATSQYPEKNKISGYEKAGDVPPVAAVPSGVPTQESKPSGGTPPWA